MYTTASGERRIRTVNIKFDVSSKPGALYESIDYLTLANVLMRNYSAKLIRGADPVKVREDAIACIGAIVGEARARCQSSTISVGSLLVPIGLTWCFAYLSSILNSRLFLKPMKSSSDDRILRYLSLQQYNPYFFANKYYPKIYPLTLDIYEVEEGEPVPGDYL